ncbi:MAG: hypothetical protein ACRDQA_08020 [Nocardioidaceae bacterium]
MTTALDSMQLGEIHLPTPSTKPMWVTGDSGQLWEWTGDGKVLVALLVASRHSNIPNEQGVKGHLSREIDQIREEMERVEITDVPTTVEHAASSRGSYVDGTYEDTRLRHGLVVSTDGQELVHVVHVVVSSTYEGRELADEIMTSISLSNSLGGGSTA